MKPGRNARKPWALVLMVFFCIGWLQPGAFLSCPPTDACPLRAAPAEEGAHARHVPDGAPALENASDQADSCSDGDARSATRACCQPSPAVLSLEQALAPSSPPARVSVQGTVFFASLRPDRLFRPPQFLL